MERSHYTFGLIGFPLDHSISPEIHRAALQDLGLDGDYHLYPVPALPGGRGLISGLLERMRASELQGLNVTIPHKENIIQFLDDLTPEAKAIGAANTIFPRGDSLVGDNTDAEGFYTDLLRLEFPAKRHLSALVLGAGGSARAVVYALAKHGWEVVIAARRPEQAEGLASSLSAASEVSPVNIQPGVLTPDYLRALDPADLLVNTTPIGMSPEVQALPWPTEIPFPPDARVYDLVYNPAVTELVRAARAMGHVAIGGSGMLVEQAALAFERWTGLAAPRKAMRAAIARIAQLDW